MAMVIAYMVVVNGLQIALRNGIGYDDFFKTAEGAYRARSSRCSAVGCCSSRSW